MQLPNGSDRNKVEFLAEQIKSLSSPVVLPYHVISNNFSGSIKHPFDSVYLPSIALSLDGTTIRPEVEDFLNPKPTPDDYGAINFKDRADKLKQGNDNLVYTALIRLDIGHLIVKTGAINPYTASDIAAINSDGLNMALSLSGAQGSVGKYRAQLSPTVKQMPHGITQWVSCDGSTMTGWISDESLPNGATLNDYQLVLEGWLEYFGPISEASVDMLGVLTVLQDFVYEPTP